MSTPTLTGPTEGHDTPTHADLLARAYANAKTRLGHPLTGPEAEAIGKALTGRLIETIITETLDPEDPHAKDSLDPLIFTETHSKVSPRWGDTDGSEARPYACAGEVLVIFGSDGSFKSTVLQGYAHRLAGVWEDPMLLGAKVYPIEGRVLYLALDRPAQIARSLARFTGRLDARRRALAAERIVIRPHSLPESACRTADGLTNWVFEYAAHNDLGPIGAVLIDNISDIYGDFADTERATMAGRAVNRLAQSGIEVVALHHPRKRMPGQGVRPESLDDVYGGRMFTKATGSVIGLYRPRASDDAPLMVTHLKGPLGFRRPLLAMPNLTTGDLTPLHEAIADIAENATAGVLTKETEEARQVLATLKALHRATILRIVEALQWKSDPKTTEKVRRILQGCSSVTEAEKSRGRATVWEWLG